MYNTNIMCAIGICSTCTYSFVKGKIWINECVSWKI